MNITVFITESLGKLSLFFLAFLIASGSIWLFELGLSYYRMRQYVRSLRFIDHRRFLDSEHMVPVSLIVAVPTEEQDARDAAETLENMLSLDFPEYEVIAVVYGEHANVPQSLIVAFQLLPFHQPYKRSLPTGELQTIYRSARDFRLIVAVKPNGDKADALNAGVNLSSYPIILSTDASAVFERDALIKVVYSFVSDPLCVAVGGAARVINEEAQHWIERRPLDLMQRTERLRALYTNRSGAEKLGAQLNICDSFFAFKKSALLEAGGYRSRPAGEEADLLLEIQENMLRKKKKFTTQFLPDPICSALPQERMREIIAERRRWHAAMLETISRHKRMILAMPGGKAGAGGLIYDWLFEVFSPLVETAGYLLVPVAWLLGAVDLWFVAAYYLLSILLGTALSAGSILLEEHTFQNKLDTGRMLWLFLHSFAENLGYRQMIRACCIGRKRHLPALKQK